MDGTGRISGVNIPQRQAPASVSASTDSGIPAPRDTYASISSNPLNLIPAAAIRKMTAPEKMTHMDSASFFEKDPQGAFRLWTKIPCDDPDKMIPLRGKDGKDHLYFTSGEGSRVSLMGEDGVLQMQSDLPSRDRAGQIAYSAGRDTLYVRGGNGLYALDPGDGKVTAKLDFKRFGYDKCIFLNRDGDLLLATDDELKILDEQLKEKSSKYIGFRPDEIGYLKDGTLMCRDDRCPAHILVTGPDGSKVIEEHNARLNSTVFTDDGRLYFVRETVRNNNNSPREVVSYDPSTGKLAAFATTKNADCAAPLSDGSTIVFDDRLARPRLILYSPGGEPQWQWSYKKEGFLRQLLITTDEKTAYMVVDRYFDKSGTETERELYRLSLDRDSGLMGKIASTVTCGRKNDAELLYVSKGDGKTFIPGVFSDGRIVILQQDGIHLLSKDGREEKTYQSVEDLQKDLTPGAEIVSRGIKLGTSQGSNIKAESLFSYARSVYGRNNPSAYPMQQAGAEKFGFCETDRTLNIGSSADEALALQQMGLKDRQELQALQEGNSVLNFSLTKNIELPLPDSPGKARVCRQSIEVEIPGAGTKADRVSFGVRDPLFYSCVLPVSTGKRNFVFAATSDGILHWYDVQSGKERQIYDLGSGIKKIIAKDSTIFAVNVKNGVFALRPELEEGESLKGGPGLDGFNTKAAGDDAEIEDGGEFIAIGGVKLSKNPGMYKYLVS